MDDSMDDSMMDEIRRHLGESGDRWRTTMFARLMLEEYDHGFGACVPDVR